MSEEAFRSLGRPFHAYRRCATSAQGLGAESAPAHKDLQHPLDAPVAGDSGALPNVGITEINNKSAGKSGEHFGSEVCVRSALNAYCHPPSGGLNTEGTDGTTRVGVGAPVSTL